MRLHRDARIVDIAREEQQRFALCDFRGSLKERGGTNHMTRSWWGTFQADTGTINQLLHLWKFEDDGDRRAHWTAVYANKDFVEGFASKFRPLLMTQEVKPLQAAPWGPHP